LRPVAERLRAGRAHRGRVRYPVGSLPDVACRANRAGVLIGAAGSYLIERAGIRAQQASYRALRGDTKRARVRVNVAGALSVGGRASAAHDTSATRGTDRAAAAA